MEIEEEVLPYLPLLSYNPDFSGQSKLAELTYSQSLTRVYWINVLKKNFLQGRLAG